MKVIGIDINLTTVNTINAGKIPIVEPDLAILVQDAVHANYLQATTSTESADVFLITVPTPFKKNHEPDLSYVEAAVQSIASVLKKNNLIILESTSPVGTTEQISRQLATLRNDLIFPHQNSTNPDINIAYCPERVMPGRILKELIENDRIIGGYTKQCALHAQGFYQLFVKGYCVTTDCRTAEMTKLTENAFRDVNIAFANELSMICEKLHIDVWELIKLANHHPRVNILQPGVGVGGHCIAVDPWFIVNATPNEAKLIRTAREVNNSKPKFIFEKIKSAMERIKHPTVACFGITYKADTDDLRESPAIEIVEALLRDKITVVIVEPNIIQLPSRLQHHCQLVTMDEALELANILVLLVNHKEFFILNEIKLCEKTFISAVNFCRSESINQQKNDKPLFRATLQSISELAV